MPRSAPSSPLSASSSASTPSRSASPRRPRGSSARPASGRSPAATSVGSSSPSLPASWPAACNVVVVSGHLSRPPEERRLPSGDVVVGYDVTVRLPGQPADSVPVSWSGPDGSAPGLDADTGDAVVVFGRARRRFFRAGGVTQSRTEVVAASLVLPRSAGRARTSVERALRVALDDAVARHAAEAPARRGHTSASTRP